MTLMTDEKLTPQEIAKLYRISAQTVRRQIAKGTLVGERFGKQYRVRVSDLEKFLKEQNKAK